jgi:phosphatidylinositol phospholipase C, delta
MFETILSDTNPSVDKEVHIIQNIEVDTNKDKTTTMDDDNGNTGRRPSRGTLLAMSCRTPATSVSRAMVTNVTAATPTLRSGISVRKVTSRGNIKPRVVTISKDRLALFCTHQPIKTNHDNNKGDNTSSSGVLSTMASKLPIPILSSKGCWFITKDYRSEFLRYMDVADIDFVCTGDIVTRCMEQAQTQSCRILVKKNDIDRNHIVTIGHHGDQTLDVLVADDTEREALIDCVNQMREAYEEASFFVSHDALLLRYIWYDVDINKDGRISESEFHNILPRINFDVKDPSKAYRTFCKNRSLKQGKGLVLPDVVALLQTIKNNGGSMTDKIWNQCFGDKDIVEASEFLVKFVYEAQGEKTKSLIDVHELFKMINGMEIDHSEGEPDHIDANQQLSRARFGVYLYHELNDTYDPNKLKIKTESKFDQPISAFFINTSHNTYLMGDQLQSSSSVEMYARALRRGCKCLELDCWDGEGKPSNGTTITNLHPDVFHGHTLTSKILFADILNVVKNYLSDYPETYPIILSLETHCSTPFQTVMAQLLLQTFGSKLFIPPTPLPETLPSPESLRGMIVIKGKRPPDPDDGTLDNSPDDDYDPYDLQKSGTDNSSKPSPRMKNEGDPNSVPAKPPKVCKELSRLTLFHGTKWKSFDQSITEPCSHMHSIGESKITKILSKSNENGQLWRRYNEQHMTRTYPAGSRVDSSNYNPLLAWSVGCQLVALNFQTNDTPLILNDGLFRQNSNCGYVLKPDLSTSQPSIQLKIRILSGCCLPKPLGAKSGETIDPFVQVSVHDIITSSTGVSSYINYMHTTNTVNDNGFCPIWDEPCKDYTIHHPNIAMIQFILKETDIALHDEVGYAAIPISCLRTGYRSIQLYDRNNTRSGPYRFASLLVHISIDQQ